MREVETETEAGGRGRRARAATPGILIALILLLPPMDAQAQSSGLGWLRDIERWTHQEDYRTWIGHGVVTTASTLFGHWVFGKAHYGAGAAVMFYVGIEYQELRRDDWVVHNKLDKFMDLAVPITVGALLVTILSDDRPNVPSIMPLRESADDLEGEILMLRMEGLSAAGAAADLAMYPTLPFLRGPVAHESHAAAESPERR